VGVHINAKKWNVELIGALKRELKVYIPMFASAEMAEALHKELSSHGYRSKCFSKRLSETEKKEIFADINNAVSGKSRLFNSNSSHDLRCEYNNRKLRYDICSFPYISWSDMSRSLSDAP